MRFALLMMLTAAILSGCGGAEPASPLSGEVTLDGQPLDVAMMTLIPEASVEQDESPVPLASAVIDGAFTFDVQPAAGVYDVTITPAAVEFSAVDAAIQAGEPPTLGPTPIPRKYQSPGELTAIITAGSQPPLRFELRSMPPR